MKNIVKTIPERTVVRFRCDKCGTKYRSLKRAQRCEAMPVEEKFFCVGEPVSGRGLRSCNSFDEIYRLRGKVVKILGPGLPDEDYNIRFLQGKLRGLHVYQYEVVWRCKHCDEPISGLFYGMELIRRGEK